MAVYLARKGLCYSPVTIHKYMNKEMGLYAIVRPKKPEYMHGKPHKVIISWPKTSLLSGRIKNGVQILLNSVLVKVASKKMETVCERRKKNELFI